MKVTLPEEGNDPYLIGDTKTTYKVVEKSLSGLDLDTVTGSSSVFQFISREEQEENPGDFDCLFELENTSEFEMDLKEVKIYEGPLDEGNIRVEWLGKDFPEEERYKGKNYMFVISVEVLGQEIKFARYTKVFVFTKK